MLKTTLADPRDPFQISLVTGYSLPFLRKLMLSLLIFHGSFFSCFAQRWEWVDQFGGTNHYKPAEASTSATDPSGNTYIAGTFEGGITIGQRSHAGNGFYVAKINSQGDVVWSTSFSSSSRTSTYVRKILTDQYGAVYVYGDFEGTLALEGGIRLALPLNGVYDVLSSHFLIKYNADGTASWAKHLHGNFSINSKGDILTDKALFNGGFSTAAKFRGFVNSISPDSLRYYNSSGNKIRRIYNPFHDIEAYTETDIQIKVKDDNFWYFIRSIRGLLVAASYDYSSDTFTEKLRIDKMPIFQDIVFDNQHICFLGSFEPWGYETVTLGDIVVGPSDPAADYHDKDAYLAKFDLQASRFAWAKRVLWGYNNYLAVGASGKIYHAVDPLGLNSTGRVYVYDQEGTLLWQKISGSFIHDYNGLGIDQSENIYVAATASNGNTITFGAFTIVFDANTAGFLAKINPLEAEPVPTISVSEASGSITTCSGTASSSPAIQKFTIEGSTLKGQVTIDAPDNFDISLYPGSGYTNQVTLKPVKGIISARTVYVRASSNAPAGTISGNVVLTSSGAATKNVAVTGTVNVYPLTYSWYLPEGHVNSPYSVNLTTLPAGDYTFSASSLPEGLTLNTTTGLISGIPKNYESVMVEILANGACPQLHTYSLTINKAVPVISIENNYQFFDGKPKSVSITTTPENINVETYYDGGTELPVNAGLYYVTVVASNDQYFGTAADFLHIEKAQQYLYFPLINDRYTGDAPFVLHTETTSSLPIAYTSSNPGVATINGDIVTIKGPGETTITARLEGDDNHYPFTAYRGLKVIDKAPQTIAFSTIAQKTFGDEPFALDATASSGLPVTFTSSDPAVAIVMGNTITIIGAGTASITASQAGNRNFKSATAVQTLKVAKRSQTIIFDAIPSQNLGNASFPLNASSSSGLPVTYITGNPSIAAISGNILTIKGAGTTTITALQAGNKDYDAAPPVAQSLFISNKLPQTITFNAIASKKYGESAFQLNATTTSGLAVSYTSSDPSIAIVTGRTVTIKAPGTTTITAMQSGNPSYLPAASVSRALTVEKGEQSISFGGFPQTIALGSAPLILGGTSTSGLPITYESNNTAVATVNGKTMSITGPGWVTVTASQPGNESYTAATPVSKMLYVSRTLQSITFNTLQSKHVTDDPFTLTATSTSGLPVKFKSSNTKVATVAGDIVTLVGNGITKITAYQDGNETYEPASPVTHDLVVTQDNVITSIAPRAEADDINLFPNPASGLVTVSLKKLTPEPVLVSLYDRQGRMVLEFTRNSQPELSLDLNSLASGIYAVRVANGRHIHWTRLVKN